MQSDEFLHFENEKYIYDLFEQYKLDKESVPLEWRRFFQGMDLGGALLGEKAVSSEGFDVKRLVEYFLLRGHLFAKISSLKESIPFDKLALRKEFGLTEGDMGKRVSVPELNIGDISISDLIDLLQQKYCTGLGVEFSNTQRKEEEIFLHKEIIHGESISKEEVIYALKEVGKAKLLEDFLQKKFLGAKRFSLEGGESVVSLMKILVNEGAKAGFSEGYIGMAHRGRVNTLCHIMEKPYEDMFAEFKGDRFPLNKGLGDVKYHNGYQNRVKTLSGEEIYLEMAANPSHLEAVDAVIPGMIRARLDEGLDKALGIVIHGDAAVAGQGIVYETMQFSALKGYSSGGIIHIVIDNHIGFTTYPEDSRSTPYPTDIAKAFSVPVLHVDAGDLKAVITAAKLALKYRDTFGRDIFIHYNCHRKYGHNEGDEPRFTNPTLYQKIKEKGELYDEIKDEVVKQGYLTSEEIVAFEKGVKDKLSSSFETLCPGGSEPSEDLVALSREVEEGGEAYKKVETAISPDLYEKVKKVISTVPDGMKIHPKIAKLITGRGETLEKKEEMLLDWGCAELMAYGSLVEEGKGVRLSGQDSRRGTFAHRHCVYIDQEDDANLHFPLDELQKGSFTVYNSPLSEYGVLGFEYGYSIKSKHGLAIWEAQFGDFYNGATIIIDQYISSTISKWNMESSLTLYLPHGMEGMGSEHSSGRVERFLQLAGRNNMRIFYPTTSAQIFHLVRAQALCEEKIPLVVFTPKSALRAKTAKGEDLIKGRLEEVLVRGNGDEEKVVFCSGKIGDEIIRADKEQKCAVLKIEQLYPFPYEVVKSVLEKFPRAKTFVYAQEEAVNQGAYLFVKDYLEPLIEGKGTLEYVGRKRLESTATGFSSVYKYNQERIITKVVEG